MLIGLASMRNSGSEICMDNSNVTSFFHESVTGPFSTYYFTNNFRKGVSCAGTLLLSYLRLQGLFKRRRLSTPVRGHSLQFA